MKGLPFHRLTGVVILSVFAASGAWAEDLTLSIDAGLRSMSNSPDTEKAIFDSRFGFGAGLGVSLDHGSRFRFGLDLRRVVRSGERAFAADRTSPAFQLGHPLDFTMNQAMATASYRFSKLGPVRPYLTAGAGVASWKEESNVAGLVESASGTSALFEGRLGVERQRGRARFALEGGITFIPNAVGVGGISQIYEEKDLGGLFVVAKIGFSRK